MPGKARLFLAGTVHFTFADKLVSTQDLICCLVILWLLRWLFRWPAAIPSYLQPAVFLSSPTETPRPDILSDAAWVYFVFGLFMKGWLSLNEFDTFRVGAPALFVSIGLVACIPSILYSYTSIIGPYGSNLGVAMIFSILLQSL
jgi:hypothetical protein